MAVTDTQIQNAKNAVKYLAQIELSNDDIRLANARKAIVFLWNFLGNVDSTGTVAPPAVTPIGIDLPQ